MEQLVKVLKSAGHLLEILTAVRTESVSNWDLEALQRAHDWAKYFEQVYFKLHQKPVFVSKLEKHLRLKYQGKHRPDLGSLEVNFDLFRNARKLLLESLLQNPHLCKAICSDVIKLYQQLPPSHDAGSSNCQHRDEPTSEQLLHDAAKYSEGKAMVMVLSKIKDKLLQSCNNHTAGCSLSANDVYLQTEADLLSQYLCKLLQEDVPKQSKEFLLTAKLDNLYSKESGLETIGIMLVTDIEGKSNGGDTEQCNQLVLAWLMQKCGGPARTDGSTSDQNSRVWQLPSSLLSKLSAKYFTFFKAYIDHLVKWGNSMELQYDVVSQGSLWRHAAYPENGHFDHNRLLESFSHLMRGPTFLSETVRRLVHSMCESQTTASRDVEPEHRTKDELIANKRLWEEISHYISS